MTAILLKNFLQKMNLQQLFSLSDNFNKTANEDGMIIPVQEEIAENSEQITVSIDRSYSAVPREDLQIKGEIVDGSAQITLPEFDKNDFFTHVSGYTWGFSTNPDGKKIEYYGGVTYSFSEDTKLYRVLVKYGGGSGTKDDPYIINYFDQLEMMSEEKARGYFKQTADIEFPVWATHTPINTVNELKSEPQDECFEYDGNGFAIKNLDNPLFGTVSGAVIKNVNIQNSNINVNSLDSDYGFIACRAYNYRYETEKGKVYETGQSPGRAERETELLANAEYLDAVQTVQTGRKVTENADRQSEKIKQNRSTKDEQAKENSAKLKKKYSRGGDVIIGNIPFRYIPKKTYTKIDQDILEDVTKKLEESGMKFSGVIKSDGVTLTTSETDKAKLDSIIEEVRSVTKNNSVTEQQTEKEKVATYGNSDTAKNAPETSDNSEKDEQSESNFAEKVATYGNFDVPEKNFQHENVEIVERPARPTITCEWSESPFFEEGKTYSVAEFDKIMSDADRQKVEGYKKHREQLEKDGVQLNHEDYQFTYKGEIPDFKGISTLENLYTEFNSNRTEDFTGRSLSVSDVVVISDNGTETAYFCDKKGFTEMPEFFREKEIEQEKTASIVSDSEVSDDKNPELREVLNRFSAKHGLGELNVEPSNYTWQLKEKFSDGTDFLLGELRNSEYGMPFTPDELSKSLENFEKQIQAKGQNIAEIYSRESFAKNHGGVSKLPKVPDSLSEICLI